MKGRPDPPGDFVNVALPPEEVPDDSPNPDGWMGGVRDIVRAALESRGAPSRIR